MLYIFCKQTSTRLAYILDELLNRRMGIAYKICSNADEFSHYEGAKINYSNIDFERTLIIKPHNLLFEDSIPTQHIEVKNDAIWKKTFFQNTSEDIPFDLFAASFFLLSRYEEYLPHSVDEHGRYWHEQSIAYKNEFLELPLIDIWCNQLTAAILQHYPSLSIKQNTFQFLSTIDIDFAYKYIGIGLKRQLLKFVKSIFQLRWNDAVEQLMVVTGAKKDPYDTYDFIYKNTIENRLPLLYFVLMKCGTTYDKNIYPSDPFMQRLIKKISAICTIGLHPSYYSYAENSLQNEQALLQKYSNQTITNSRQHFLRFTLPDTFQKLTAIGITDDYSMIYSGASGFRASTSHPFIFFDLITNTTLPITLHPSTVMDVTLKNRHQFSPKQALQKMEKLMNEVKKVNGTFISIWHNSNLCKNTEWKEWREVFEKLHTLASIKTQKEID